MTLTPQLKGLGVKADPLLCGLPTGRTSVPYRRRGVQPPSLLPVGTTGCLGAGGKSFDCILHHLLGLRISPT